MVCTPKQYSNSFKVSKILPCTYLNESTLSMSFHFRIFYPLNIILLSYSNDFLNKKPHKTTFSSSKGTDFQLILITSIWII